jgi:hypothetical protein
VPLILLRQKQRLRLKEQTKEVGFVFFKTIRILVVCLNFEAVISI